VTAIPLDIDKVILHGVDIPLVEPFRTNHGVVSSRAVVIVEVVGGGISGFGESSTLPLPGYSAETQASVVAALRVRFVPQLFAHSPETPAALASLIRGTLSDPLARGGLEMACWDWWARALSVPLYRLLGGERTEIPVGVAVPLFDDRGRLFESIAGYLDAGYQRIKVKLTPGAEGLIREIVRHFGPIPLMVDANGAYTRGNASQLEAIDDLGLLMIEQPLPAGDLVGHAALQLDLTTPLCLDESITDLTQAAEALDLRACRILNVKAGRVGGTTEAIDIHDLAAAKGVGVWCGGLLETGIGRAHNIALATLPNFRYPGDISASARYFDHDIISPPVTLAPGGKITVPENPGIGFAIDPDRLAEYTTARIEIPR
jgi:O-succinylbenzoate synthase